MLFWLFSKDETHGNGNYVILREEKDPGQAFFFPLEIKNNTWENKFIFSNKNSQKI